MYAYMHAYLKLVCKDKKKQKNIAISWELKFEKHNFHIEELQIKGEQ
jgi:hypothetical protein